VTLQVSVLAVCFTALACSQNPATSPELHDGTPAVTSPTADAAGAPAPTEQDAGTPEQEQREPEQAGGPAPQVDAGALEAAAGAGGVGGSTGSGDAGGGVEHHEASQDAGEPTSDASAAGAPAPSCPDDDHDGVCNAQDVCPAGSDVDADHDGIADACEQQLWTITQHLDHSYDSTTYVSVTPWRVDYSLQSSGATGCDQRLATANIGDDSRVVDVRLTMDANGDPISALDACPTFTPSITPFVQQPVQGRAMQVTPSHLAFVHVHATVAWSGTPQRSNWNVLTDVTWTAYGY
jgi:hypothetical protein